MGTASQRHELEKLTALTVKRKKKPGRYADGGGLYLQVSQSGAKSWLLRYMLDGKAREHGLGSVSLVDLKEAREVARAKRKLLKEKKVDPIDAVRDDERQRKLDLGKRRTFEECAIACHARLLPTWRNAKHGDQWINTLRDYAFPVLGSMMVASIDTPDVMRVLAPMWNSKTETAQRLMQRIRSVLDYAKVLGYRQGDNPASWDVLSKALAKPSKVKTVEHHTALPASDVPEFIAEVRLVDAAIATRRALEFLILTAARTSEVIGATWKEVNLDEAMWTIPAARMKAAREHRVPLSPRCVAILREMEKLGLDEKLVFPGRPGKPMSGMVFLMLLRRMGREITVHGFRSTFRDWAVENTNYGREVLEAALAHTEQDKTVAAYLRSDLLAKRAKLMSQWATFATTKREPAPVVQMRRKAAK